MKDPAELVLLRATREQVDEAVRWVEHAAGRAGLDLGRSAELGARVARAMIARIDGAADGEAEDLHLTCLAEDGHVVVTVCGAQADGETITCRSRTTTAQGGVLQHPVVVSTTRPFSQHRVPSRR